MSILYPDFLLPLLHFSPAKKRDEFTEEARLIIPSFDADSSVSETEASASVRELLLILWGAER